MVPIQYNIRSLLVRKTTTIATATGIGLVVFVLAAALMLTESIDRTMGAAGSDGAAIVLRQGADAELSSNIDQKFVGLALAAPGVKRDAEGQPIGGGELVTVISLLKVGGEHGAISNVTVRGVPTNVLKYRPDIRIVDGRPAQPGTDEVIVGAKIVGRFQGVKLGGAFDLRKNRPLKVVGIFEAGGSAQESEVLADIETVRTSFGREGLVSSVTAVLESPSKYDGFATTIQSDKQLGLQSQRQSDYYEKQSSSLAIFVTGIGGFITFMFGFGAIIGAMITMYGAVAQRQREIGTLRALGFSRTAILGSFLLESVILAGAGGLIGALGALCMSFATFSMVNFSSWSEMVFSFDPTPGIVGVSVFVGCMMGILGGFFPALKAARISPIDAMRG